MRRNLRESTRWLHQPETAGDTAYDADRTGSVSRHRQHRRTELKCNPLFVLALGLSVYLDEAIGLANSGSCDELPHLDHQIPRGNVFWRKVGQAGLLFSASGSVASSPGSPAGGHRNRVRYGRREQRIDEEAAAGRNVVGAMTRADRRNDVTLSVARLSNLSLLSVACLSTSSVSVFTVACVSAWSVARILRVCPWRCPSHTARAVLPALTSCVVAG
jgi:hypothetical protein